MTESELAKILAKRLKTSNGQAAERVDRLLHSILRQLRSGTPAKMPGLGTLHPSGKKPGKRP